MQDYVWWACLNMIFYVDIVWNVHSSAGGAIGISIEKDCVISCCNIMASMPSMYS